MREVMLGTDEVLDEHVVAEIHYDTKFLEAMAQLAPGQPCLSPSPD